MSKKIKVFKFGGASVQNAAAIKNVATILQKYKAEQLVIVVSAMGKMTNALEEVVQAYFKQNGEAVALLEKIKQTHYGIIKDLFGEQHEVYVTVNDAFVEIDWVLEDEPEDNYDYIYDQIVSVGELVSTKIVSAYLNQVGLTTQWLDARDVILTDDIFREAWVQWDTTQENMTEKVRPFFKRSNFVLTQGFIASTSDNYTTTLGREGSDYSAAIFSFCLDAESMSIWKDVEGVLTADPRLFKNVSKLDRLSYREAIEMTYYGAKVIHPKTIKPLQNKNIPLYVKSFEQPESAGTYIASDIEDTYPPMIAVEQNQALLYISTRDFSFVAEHHLKDLFDAVAKERLQINLMQNTAISFVICVNDIDDRVARFKENIEKDYKVVVDRALELITVRHYQEDTISCLKKGKIILLEERLQKTAQMVVKNISILERK